ncbi:GSCOCG00006870001-RA-CDS, partial [Cotesia congregata]
LSFEYPHQFFIYFIYLYIFHKYHIYIIYKNAMWPFLILGWYHTGDLGYYDEDGDFFIVERIKELIKYRLHHVAPAAIENVIQELPGVAEVAVVAKPSLEDLELPMAFVTRVPGMQVSF